MWNIKNQGPLFLQSQRDKDEVSTFEMDIEKDIKATEVFSSDFKNNLKLLFHKQWEGRND